jgi:hypothetical protein
VQKALTGSVATVNGNTTITGANSAFSFELVKGQLVRITQGVNTFDSYLTRYRYDTNATLSVAPSLTLANAVL